MMMILQQRNLKCEVLKSIFCFQLFGRSIISLGLAFVMALFETAQILSLSQLYENIKISNFVGHRFRFVGQLTRFDSINRYAYLEHQQYSLLIDLSLISMKMLKSGLTVQVVGQIQDGVLVS